MRSYQSHVATLLDPVAKMPLPPRGVFRSSAIFPVIQDAQIRSRILLLGYWMLKRDIQEVGFVVTLRSAEGTVLVRRSQALREARCYRVELSDELQALDWLGDFTGSLEIEFFSSTNLVFPYPAVVLNYYGEGFSTVVHSAQRVYNDYLDMQNNSETAVAEAGFNIYCDDQREPFASIINGPQEVAQAKICATLFNADGEEWALDIDLGGVNPYQTLTLFLGEHCDLRSFLKGKVGTAKIRFSFPWIYPRIIAGNRQGGEGVSITHTYYDCTHATAPTDYWKPADVNWFDAALYVPVTVEGGQFTKAYFYPIYSPAPFTVDVEIYDADGSLLGKLNDYLTIQSSSQFTFIDFSEICQECGISPRSHLGGRVIARRMGESFPTRIKLGLDLGLKDGNLPCNICTNLHPFNPSMDAKPHTFRWAPLLADASQANLWILNSSPAREYKRAARLQLTFFREQDTSTLTRSLQLVPNGFVVISSDDEELRAFLGKSIGWCTIKADNPYVTTYYFAQHPSGATGGDHGF